MNRFALLLGPMRAPFLLLGPACVAVGVGTAHWQTAAVHWAEVLLVLIGAVASHICVNAANEYFDFRSGLDQRTRSTPFSGGSGTLPAHPELERAALGIVVASLVVAALVGIYFVWRRGWLLLPLGLFGLLLVLTYTTWWTRHPVLCLIAPGLGFGALMVMGTHFALTGTYSWSALVASLVPTFLVSDLLLLNQFPDVEADKTVGRLHFPIAIGRRASAQVYGLLLLLAYLSVVVGVITGVLPRFSLLALLTTALAWRAYRGAYEHADNPPALARAMGLNVVVNLTTPLLLAIGLFLG